MLKKTFIALSLFGSLSFTTILVHQNKPVNSQTISTTQSLPELVARLSPQEVDNIAQAVTVKVHVGNNHGSGILIDKDDNTYTVITNNHVVDIADRYIIETADKTKHQAQIIARDSSDNGNDLAILQFTSINDYQVAKLGDSLNLKEGETVVAAGFPYDSNQINISSGRVNLISDKPIRGGYQIGFTNDTVQGMSGGVLLNAKGEVIGILGKGKIAVLENTAYQYQDGTQPTEQTKDKFRQSSFSIPIAKVREVAPQFASLLPDGDIAQNLNPTTKAIPPKNYTGIVKKVNDVAQQISVRLDVSDGSNGTGVIIARQGDTYYVATARHVFCRGQVVSPNCQSNNNDLHEVEIVTPDGKSYSLDYQTVEFILGYDALVFSFQSKQNYRVAEIADYQVASNRSQAVFVAGFSKANNPEQQLEITGGRVNERYSSSFRTKDSFSRQDISGEGFASSQLALVDSGGVGLIYTNLSSGGMSGGAVLDSQGRLVGINIGGENEIENDEEGNPFEYSIGYSLGVPISNIDGYLQSSLREKTDRGIEVAWLKNVSAIPPEIENHSSEWKSIESQLLMVEKPVAQEVSQWMNYGNQLWRYGRYEEAVSAFKKVIELDMQFDKAYYAMVLVYAHRRNEYENKTGMSLHEAVTALRKAIEINDSIYYYWRYLGLIHNQFGTSESAINAYNRAITENKNNPDFVLYVERGGVYEERGDELRELGQEQLATGEYNRALADYARAIEINPKHPWAYSNRGLVYDDLQKYDLALADYNKALEINPQLAGTYNNRGTVYRQQEKYDLALADYNKALKINANHDAAYANRGLVYNDLHKYDLALADYNKAIEINPNFSDFYFMRGIFYLQQEKYDLALADSSKILEMNFNYDNNAYILQGNVYFLQEKYDLALANYTRAIEIDSNDAYAYIFRGKVYSQQEKYDLALADYNKTLEIAPDSAMAYKNRGEVYARQEKYDLALADYNKALEISPSNDGAYNNRGEVYARQEKYDLALADYNKALEINPDSADAYYNRGNIYADRQQYDLALADYSKAIEINPNSAKAYVSRGNMYVDRQKYDLALSDYKKLIEINPQLAGSAYIIRGNIYLLQEKYDLALVDFNKALETEPNSAKAYYSRGKIYSLQQKYDLALTNYSQALEINPQLSEAYLLRGQVYFLQEKYDLALVDHNKLLEIDPNYAGAYYSRGKIYARQENYDLALADFSQALEIDPNDTEAYYYRGLVYAQQEKYDLALTDYSKALEIDPNDTEAYYYRGKVYFLQEKYDLAVTDYSKALEINPNYADAYFLRGNTYVLQQKYDLAKQNIETARNLFEQQGNMQDYQSAIEILSVIEMVLELEKKVN